MIFQAESWKNAKVVALQCHTKVHKDREKSAPSRFLEQYNNIGYSQTHVLVVLLISQSLMGGCSSHDIGRCVSHATD